jgi:hypothetical protein
VQNVMLATALVSDPETMIARVAAEAKRTYGHAWSPEELDRLAREVVTELWNGDVRVTHFLPTLAAREIRDRLAARRSGTPSR